MYGNRVVALIVFSFPLFTAEESSRALITPTPVRRAIFPTAPGQIGIDPVLSDLGPLSQYAGTVGGFTSYISSVDSTSTKWIGVNTEYLTLETITTSGTTTVSKIQLTASTVSSASEGQASGGVSVLIVPAILDAIQSAGQAANKACSVAKQRKRQDSLARCLIPYASKAAAPGGILDDIAADLEALAIDIPNIVDPILAAAFQVAKNQGRKITFLLVCVSFGIIAYDNLPSVLNFPPVKTVGTTPKSSPSCPSSAMTPPNQPGCPASGCNAVSGTCQAGPYKGCRCLNVASYSTTEHWDLNWWNEQQRILNSVTSLLDAAASLTCSVQSIVGFDSTPLANPPTWCICGSSFSASIYPTIASSTTSQCAFITVPTSTISVTFLPYPTPIPAPTNCTTTTYNSIVKETSGYTSILTSCLCNNNKFYPTTTTSGRMGCATPIPPLPSSTLLTSTASSTTTVVSSSTHLTSATSTTAAVVCSTVALSHYNNLFSNIGCRCSSGNAPQPTQLHVNQPGDGSCVPSLANASPICEISTIGPGDLGCKCGKWLSNNPHMPGPMSNPCSGYPIQASSNTFSAPCTAVDPGGPFQGCTCSGGSEGQSTSVIILNANCPKATTWSTQATIY